LGGKKYRSGRRCISPSQILGPVYCICNKTWEKYVDPLRLQCECCENWFHATCVNVLEEKASSENFICTFCKENKKVPQEFEVSKELQHNFSFVIKSQDSEDAWDLSSIASSISSIEDKKEIHSSFSSTAGTTCFDHNIRLDDL